MEGSGSGRRLAATFDEVIWMEAVRGFSGRALEIAESGKRRVERVGIALNELRPCEELGGDGTALKGCAKLYLPPDGPPSARPYGVIFRLVRCSNEELVWQFVGFGLRHPPQGVRSVYERAHRQLYAQFPERT